MRIRLNSLQFLRFLAFLGVFLLHGSPQGGDELLPFSFLAAIAFYGVSFFTVLSGFVSALKLPFTADEVTPKKILKYLWKKLKQFYPLYMILLTARFIYHLLPLVPSGAAAQIQTLTVQYIRCALLIETWIDHSYFELTGAAWYMSVIFFLYILEYPFLDMIGKTERKHGRKGLMILLICVVIMDFFLQYEFHIHTYTSNPEYWNYVFPPARIGEYLAGMTACRLMVPYFRGGSIMDCIQDWK